MKIGDFEFNRWDNGILFMSIDSGEGMEIDEDKLNKVLKEYYDENF